MSNCNSCGAPIRWAETTNGRRMPVNAEPDPDGNVVLLYPSPGAALAMIVDPGQTTLDDAPRYLSHFATCPNADQHRKDRRTHD